MSIRHYLKQLAGESAIYGVSGVIGRCVGIFLIPIYTRIFTPADYGVISLLGVFGSLAGMMAVLALDNSSARWFYDTEQAEDRRVTISSWFWTQLSVGGVIAVVSCALAPQISRLLTDSEEYENLVRLVAIGIPLATGGKVLGNWLRYQRRATSAVIFTIGQTLGNVGLIIFLVVFLRYGLTGLYTAHLATAMVILMISVTILKEWISPSVFSWPRLRSMLRYALPLIPAAAGLWVMASMDRVMLKRFTAISEVGLYSIAALVASGIDLLTAAFTQAWGPFAYSILKQPDAGRVYSRVLDLYSFLGCVACAALSLFAPLILRILTTEAFYPAASTVAFLAFASLLYGGRFIASLGCGIEKKSVPAAVSVAIGAAVNFALNLLLIPYVGRNGAALASMLGWGISAAYLFRASQRYHPIPYRWLTPLSSLGLAFGLIGLDRWLITGHGVAANVGRGALLLSFIPLGATLGLLRWRDIRSVVNSVRRQQAFTTNTP